MSSMISGLVLLAISGCADSDSRPESSQQSSAVMTETEMSQTDSSTGNEVAAAQSSDSSISSDDTVADTPASAESNVQVKVATPEADNVTESTDKEPDQKVAGETAQQTSSEVEAGENATTDQGNSSDNGEQVSTIGPELPESLRWLTDWKERDFSWMTDWKNALNEIRRPLVLRPETPWPLEPSSDAAIENGTSTAIATASPSAKNQLAQISGESSAETGPSSTESRTADSQ